VKYVFAEIFNRLYLNWEKVLKLGNRSGTDRRSMVSRRKEYAAAYLMEGGVDKRRRPERRKQGERRNLWQRIARWTSIYSG